MRYLYLHGFASGPSSSKARFFAEKLRQHGIDLEVPPLDRQDFEHLTITGQLGVLDEQLQGEPALLLGSSMGAYLASLYASIHTEAARLVLLAPAFHLARLFEESTPASQFATWRRTGWREIFHYASGTARKIHFGLMEDARRYPAEPDFLQPGLIFHGRHDEVVPISAARDFTERHANVRLHELDSGHELLDVLDQIAAIAIPFLVGE